MNALMRRRGMMQMGVNTTDSKKLVAEFTLSEDSKTINVEIPAEAQVYKLFVAVLNGQTSASEWIYPALNETSVGTNTEAYFGQTAKYSERKFAIAPIALWSNTARITTGIGNFAWASATYPVTNIFMRLYNETSLFKAGFSVKVYAIDI